MSKEIKILGLAIVTVGAVLTAIFWPSENRYIAHFGGIDSSSGRVVSMSVITDGGSLPLPFTTVQGEEVYLILDRSLQEDPETGIFESIEDGELYLGYDNFGARNQLIYTSPIGIELKKIIEAEVASPAPRYPKNVLREFLDRFPSSQPQESSQALNAASAPTHAASSGEN